MRLESSPLMAVSTTDGSVPVFWFDTVGSDSSSATNGSSIVIVAGKNRDPAKPWAHVPAVGKIVSAIARASLARPSELAANIGGFPYPGRAGDRPRRARCRPGGKSPIGEEAALSLRWRASADGAGQSTRRGLRGRRENAARSGKRDQFKRRTENQRECGVAMPEAAEGGVVVNRFRSLVSRVVGGVSIPREAQRMLVERCRKIAAVVGGAQRAGPVQGRYRDDLQQQSHRGKQRTETPAGPAGPSALRLSPQPYGHIEQAPPETGGKRRHGASLEPDARVPSNLAR